jgi:AcrR family transcriptional regulator
MSTTDTPSALPQRPKRADARRNYEKLLVAAREVFTREGGDAPLEEIAKAAGVGIGTLYRHFPTRNDLLEAAYAEEVESIARSAAGREDMDPWDALASWLREYAIFSLTKRVLGNQLITYMDRDSELFRHARAVLTEAAEPLLLRAQAAGVVRADAAFMDVIRLAGGIAQIQCQDPAENARILDMALDGLRPRPSA